MYFLCDFSGFVDCNYGRYAESCHPHDFRWVKLSGTDLLPGDVVSIGRSSGQNGEDKSVPADMLLLAGSAIVNEAILTGESTPQWKVVLFSVSNKCCLRAFKIGLSDTGFDMWVRIWMKVLCLGCWALTNTLFYCYKLFLKKSDWPFVRFVFI